VTLLGLECGGTRTVALLAAPDGRCLRRVEAGPANMRLMSDTQMVALFKSVAKQMPRPAALGIGMAGVLDPAERRRVREAAARAWPGIPCWAGNDLETALAAADEPGVKACPTRVILISGTGSCCYGRNATGQTAKVGGWGHVLGDRASGYDIAHRALRAVIHDYDRRGRWPALGERFLRALALNTPNHLVTWAQAASKTDLAALAVEVFRAGTAGDPLAGTVVSDAALTLAQDAATCARRLARAGTPVEFILTGGVLLKQPPFVSALKRRLRRLWPAAVVKPLRREGAWGAVVHARELLETGRDADGGQGRLAPALDRSPSTTASLVPRATATSPTERRNPRSMRLDRMSLRRAIRLMLSEDARIPAALLRQRKGIERAVRMVVQAFRRGGRLFYVGAGTSGRLGVLDASECPPTFRAAPEMVQGIIAGGQRALWAAVEGAEDDAAAGAQAVQCRGVSRRDVVVGIAASGRTPFVWGALRAARSAGAKTILLCFNPHLEFGPGTRVDLVLAFDVGPEVLTGSTRLKAGTATKLVLNIVTTLAMVRLGKVVSNLMVDLNPSNAKLRDRAVRIVHTLTRAGRPEAQAALEARGWRVKEAIEALRKRKPARRARHSRRLPSDQPR
jgi:N-acetylmuramic acid 6-phosphate etherase